MAADRINEIVRLSEMLDRKKGEADTAARPRTAPLED